MKKLIFSDKEFEQLKNYVLATKQNNTDYAIFFILRPAVISYEKILESQHPTEIAYPEQTKRFKEITEEMYQVFLEKNNDYSKWNILATGIVGITTRFWDKTARIMNLVGFNIGTGEYKGFKENMVKDEKLDQTFIDSANYSIIAKIYLEGK